MNKFHRVALAATIIGLALAPASATHSWGGYHWAGDGSKLPLKVNRAITSQWTTSVNTAIADWDKSTELALTAQDAPAGTDRRQCNPISGQILMCNAAYGRRGWLGIASIWLTNGHISQGTTKLNDSYHDSAPYNSPSWRALVACQEVGHDFGLDHQDETFNNANLGTCMDYTSNPDGPPANTSTNSHDYDELRDIYNHNDGFTTAGAFIATRGAAAGKGIGDSPAEWGRAVHRDQAGRPDVFVKDIDRGTKAITHVYWAIGEGPKR